MTLEFDPFAFVSEFEEIGALEPPFWRYWRRIPAGDFADLVIPVVISFGQRGIQHGFTMKDDDREGEGPAGTPSNKNPRQDRLKLALRENLKRRKSQARGRSDVTTAPAQGDDVPPPDESETKPGK